MCNIMRAEDAPACPWRDEVCRVLRALMDASRGEIFSLTQAEADMVTWLLPCDECWEAAHHAANLHGLRLGMRERRLLYYAAAAARGDTWIHIMQTAPEFPSSDAPKGKIRSRKHWHTIRAATSRALHKLVRGGLLMAARAAEAGEESRRRYACARATPLGIAVATHMGDALLTSAPWRWHTLPERLRAEVVRPIPELLDILQPRACAEQKQWDGIAPVSYLHACAHVWHAVDDFRRKAPNGLDKQAAVR